MYGKSYVDVLIPTLAPSNVKVLECLEGFHVIVSSVKGISKARNDLAKRSKAEYLLYVDDGVDVSRDTFERYISPAIEDNAIVAYEGEGHPSICTRIFGIPRNVMFFIGGFDESFDIGEDLEIGYRLMAFGFPVRWIPTELVMHKNHYKRSRWKMTYKIIARLALRYKKPKILFLLKQKRKSAPLGIVVTVFSFFFYLFRNKRESIDV